MILGLPGKKDSSIPYTLHHIPINNEKLSKL
jgi:hypothetical protein